MMTENFLWSNLSYWLNDKLGMDDIIMNIYVLISTPQIAVIKISDK